MNTHGAYSYWKQDALGAAGVRRVWAGAGPQRAAYRGGGISCGLAHSSFTPSTAMSFTVKDKLVIKSLTYKNIMTQINTKEVFDRGWMDHRSKKTYL